MELEDAIVAIDWLEDRARLDFMPDVDPAQVAALEEQPAELFDE